MILLFTLLGTLLTGLTLNPHAALATTATPTPTPTSTAAEERVQPLCEAPAEGRYSCFALRHARPADDKQADTPMAAGDTPDGFGPADLIDAYEIPAGGGAGQTVAVVAAFDAPTAEKDLATYREKYGLPPCTTANGCFRKVDQRGGTDYPVADAGWAGEIALDLDMVSAIAPRANLLLVEADSNYPDDLGAAVDQAVAMGAKFVNNSYGTGREYPDQGTLDVHYNHPGVAIVAASGDWGYGVSYPAASTYVTSVGGTTLTRDSSERGWSETVWNSSWVSQGTGTTVWGATGSGCSKYALKPAFQTDAGCQGRTVADVSAVADPVTGVAVYNSYSDEGWSVYGGTSAASPIVTAIYAVAGTPVQDTDANSYPYANTAALYDVTKGDDASCPAGLCQFGTVPQCDPAYLCVAQTGYDGPTGIGTPKGTAAFRAGPHGTVTGKVTDATTKAAIPGALVTLGQYTATTDAGGVYKMTVPAGTYEGTVAAYAYAQGTIGQITLSDGESLTRDVALTALPAQTVSGTVTDGGGHGWPLYAKIEIEGVPGGPVFTDPATGEYSVKLPLGKTYELTVTAAYQGYLPKTETVELGSQAVRRDVALPPDADKADAPGYSLTYHGGGVQEFDSREAPEGWTVKNNTDKGGWQFDDPLGHGNQTGGGGGFAIVDDFALGWAEVDTELRSPSFDLSQEKEPVVEFDTHFPRIQQLYMPQADLDVSVDGGETWTTLWRSPREQPGPAHVSVPIGALAAGKSDVRVRFHYVGHLGNIWQVDKVAVGTRVFKAEPGGLLAGRVTDASTDDGVVGATVTTGGNRAISVATPEDQAIGDGVYWLFSPETGQQVVTAEKAAFGYPAQTRKLNVVSGAVTRADFKLGTGRLTAAPAALSADVTWGEQDRLTFTVRNTGTTTTAFKLGERPSPVKTGDGAAVSRVQVPPADLGRTGGTYKGRGGTPPQPGTAWQPLAELPEVSTGMIAATHDGKLYAGLGSTGQGTLFSNTFSSYDPETGAWTKLTSPWYRRWSPAAGFIGDRLYVTSGRDSTGATVAATEAYDPGTGTWKELAPNPSPFGSSGYATLDGRLYVVGGCYMVGMGAENCANKEVMVYDPAADKWSKAASYPVGISRLACGGIDGRLYCAGGMNGGGTSADAYAYDPKANAWSPVADLPLDLAGSAYAVANGKLLISTGFSYGIGAVTNEGFAYDPAANSWSPLPNADAAMAGAAGATGFYLVGGTDAATGLPVGTVRRLPGYDQPHADVPWLSARAARTELRPGQSTTVTVTLDADRRTTSMLSEYTAAVTLLTDSPHQIAPVPVTMKVRPPKSWGRLTGTVSGPDGPLAGASVRLEYARGKQTVVTGADGRYDVWLERGAGPVRITVTMAGYGTATGTLGVSGGDTVVKDFTLSP
ncbi:carboxypeptidase regulatory-like domain-containing protein [Nonomuraea sp. CA-141351]|uniref:carboxypeptidase regulatory-like domain-containing protein n=1 Tax=Nonomuraea sp. CA-141351 TaxID=3239996 RepID=UPI003D94DDA0